MTYQQDPDRNRNVGLGRGPRDYIRRDDGTWSPVVLVLGAVLLVLIGWFILSDRATGPTKSTTTRVAKRTPADLPKRLNRSSTQSSGHNRGRVWTGETQHSDVWHKCKRAPWKEPSQLQLIRRD